MSENIAIKNDLKKAPRTGDWGIMRPEIDESKCIGCGNCASFCPDAAIEIVTRDKNDKSKFKKVAKIDYNYCKGCGVCASVCPVNAITMKKK